MSRWKWLPPSALQRWIARHALAIQVGLGSLALASAVLSVISLRSEDLDSGSVASLLNVVVFLALIWTVRGIARYVVDYDQRD